MSFYGLEQRALLVTLVDREEKARISRNIDTLEGLGFEVTVLSPNLAGKEGLNSNLYQRLAGLLWVPLLFLGLAPALLRYLESRYAFLADLRSHLQENVYDIIFVEEAELLPHVCVLRDGLPTRFSIIMDLRDFYWRDNSLFNDVFTSWTHFAGSALKSAHFLVRKFIYRRYLPKTDKVIVVSTGHQKKLTEFLSVDAVLVRNTSHYFPQLNPVSRDDGLIKFVYHGLAARRRSIEVLIHAFKRVPGTCTLHFYLVADDPGHLEELKRLADSRIHFHDPVPLNDLVCETNKYDVGIAFFPPLSTTLEDVLPNKFFEYIQARLAILSGPAADMKNLVELHRLGLVTEDHSEESLLKALTAYNKPMIDEFKSNVHAVARELCFEKERQVLEGVIAQCYPMNSNTPQ